VPHDEFVDRIIDDLFEQDIDSVIVMGSIPGPPDIHPGPGTDVLERREGFDLTFVVNVFFIFVGHITDY
jgi:hypothetical protein